VQKGNASSWLVGVRGRCLSNNPIYYLVPCFVSINVGPRIEPRGLSTRGHQKEALLMQLQAKAQKEREKKSEAKNEVT